MVKFGQHNSLPKLATPAHNSAVSSSSASLANGDSAKSSPIKNFFRGSRQHDTPLQKGEYVVPHTAPSSPDDITSLPQLPQSSQEEIKIASEGGRKGFLQSLRSKKSAYNIRPEQLQTIRPVPDDASHIHNDPLPNQSSYSLSATQKSTDHISVQATEPFNFTSLNGDAQRKTGAIPPSASTRTLSLPKDGVGHKFLDRVKQTSSRAKSGFLKAATKITAKKPNASGTGSSSNDAYEVQILTLPLTEQVRRTRTSSGEGVDKIGFWLPSLPKRCLEFFELRGYAEEGLYRIPGAKPSVTHWYQRFDKEGDINLLNEDIPDLHTIGSLFKQWLRELPTDILPQEVQRKIEQAHPNATRVPQLMQEELAKLPPCNYHLLFAITNHLSKLIRSEETTRMNYTAVRLCVPGLRIENFCLHFLLTQWEDCFSGCKPENDVGKEEGKEMTTARITAASSPPELDQVQPQSPFNASFA